MAIAKLLQTTIAGIASVIPSYVEDINKSELFSSTEKENLIKHTGIRYRLRVKQQEETVQAYFAQAFRSVLKQLDWDKKEVKVLVCVTQTPQVPIPSIACLLHDELDLSHETMCYDINSGCSGFVYGLHTVSNLLNSLADTNAKAVLLCGDISSRLIESSDKATQPIFSDGVSAIALENNPKNEGKVTGCFHLETMGKGKDAIYAELQSHSTPIMRLNGIDVFNYSLSYVPKNITTLLEHCSQDLNNIDGYIFHQANKIINVSIAKKLKLEQEKVPSTLYDYGNMASASIPLTLSVHWENMKKQHNKILVSGFGVGFSVGSAILDFAPTSCPPPEVFST